ncbi:hypothetical protein A5N81_19490 [Pseudomonas aeruginosa]|nr:hypothetical protein A5N81_19490 [Pseudomonas aeruginosa]
MVAGPVTPRGAFQGSLAGVSAVDLGPFVFRDAFQRPAIAAKDVQEVTMGGVLPAGLKQGPARQAGGQDATHDHFLYVLGGDAGALHRFADHDGTQVDRGNAGQAALEAAHGSTGAGDDDDIGHGTLPLVLDRV